MEKISTLVRSNWQHLIIVTGILAAAIVVAGLVMTVQHPAAGEIMQNQVISIMLMLISLGAAFGAGIIARGIWRSCDEVSLDFHDGYRPLSALWGVMLIPVERGLQFLGVNFSVSEPGALPAWVTNTAEVDTVVSMLPGEDYAAFRQRVEDSREMATHAKWIAVISPKEAGAVIFSGPDTEDVFLFSRNLPPFAGDIPAEQMIPEGIDFVGETAEQYAKYVAWFTYHFRRWASGEKLRINPKRAGRIILETLTEKAKMSASVVALILLSLPAFSQKTEQVSATPIARKITPAGEAITYVFSQSDQNRVGDGEKNYVELLKALPNFRNGGGGKLLTILAGGRPVYKASEIQEVAPTKAAAMRPRSEAIDPGDVGNGFPDMPDSVSMAEMAERAKYEIWKGTEAASQAAAPWWEVIMFTFWQWSPLTIIIMMLAWMWARVGAEEGFWAIYRPAKRVLIIISLCVATLFMVNIFLWFKSLNMPAWTMFGVAAAECLVAVFVLTRINPDYRPAKGNNPNPPANGFYTPNQPRITRGES